MATISDQQIPIDEVKASFSLAGFLMVILAALFGALAAVYVLPAWIPGLSASVTGPDPKAFWYLARGSAFSAYLLLWLSMILGVGITNKLAALWPGLPPSIDLHQYTSILGLAFGLFHGLVLMGDHYINFRLIQIFLPFSTTNYKPFMVGLGQLGAYLWAFLIISFYVRKRIGSRAWRWIHFSSFFMYAFALIHGVWSGTDTTAIWAQAIYWSTGLVFLILTVYRVIYSRIRASKKKNSQQVQKNSVSASH